MTETADRELTKTILGLTGGEKGDEQRERVEDITLFFGGGEQLETKETESKTKL